MKLKAPKDRVIICIDMNRKNQHSFADGTTIYIGRQYNNLNQRETQPVNAEVVDSEYIPEGSEILIHHNSVHQTYLINDYQKLSGENVSSDIKYYSIEEDRCYLWREPGGEWKPLKGYATALRVYEPYKGFLVGIDPKVIKNALLITSGELNGQVAIMLLATDYEIIYQGDDNRESRVIRVRHFEGEEQNEREEVVAIDAEMTQKVHAGELLVGLSETKCEVYNEVNIYG